MSIEQKIVQFSPKSLRLPVLYNYRKFRKRIEKEIFYLATLLPEGHRAIDVGANQGIYSYVLSKRCKIVEAFEPQSWCTGALSDYSKGKNINIYNVGLSDFNGKLQLNIPIETEGESNDMSHLGMGKNENTLASFREIEGDRSSVEVPVCKLDDYNFDDVSFIKIDVEGYESQVLTGAHETICREKPTILVEIEQRHLGHKSIGEVFNQITDLGYEGSYLSNDRLKPLSKFSYQNNQEPFLDRVCSDDYINNFIFKACSKV